MDNKVDVLFKNNHNKKISECLNYTWVTRDHRHLGMAKI